MANEFNKEERVAFEDLLEGFDDALVLSRMVSKYDIGDVEAERGSDTVWRPVPYIAQSFSGLDQSSNFGDSMQLSVPATIGTVQSSHFALTATELRDGLQENRLAKAARQKLASDINVAVMNTAANEGTVFVQRTGAASGFSDVAECDAAFNELGIEMDMRHLALSSRDYNNMASDLAGRETMNGKPTRAYERAYVGEVAGFDTYKLDYANSLTAAAGVTVTINGADQYYTPVATTTSANGINKTNTDNRYQTITIGVSSGTVKVGDAFTIAGVNSVHHITKADTGQLKTFRIHEIVTGAGGAGTVKISPPIISAEGATDAEEQYKNVTATPATGAAITFLNIAAASVNPFWRYDAIELLPSKLIMPANSGMATMSATTDQGVTVLMSRQAAIGTMKVQYRLDVMFGTVCTNPEMAGLMMFAQT